MKTVIDAVNELKGDVANSRAFGGDESFVYFDAEFDAYGTSYEKHKGNYDINHVCTIKEYNELVTQLSHTAGEYEFNQYLISDKTPLTKEVDYASEDFWKDAPEWAVDVRTYTGKTGGYIYTNGYDTIQNIAQSIVEDIAYPVLTVDKWKVIAIRPQPKPVYTQEMHDKSELKSGQEVFIAQINTNAGVVDKRYYIKEYWCDSGFQNEYIELGLLFVDKESAEKKCKELLGVDTRTDKEKLFDQVNSIPRIYIKDAEKFVNDIIDGKIHGVTWSKGNE